MVYLYRVILLVKQHIAAWRMKNGSPADMNTVTGVAVLAAELAVNGGDCSHAACIPNTLMDAAHCPLFYYQPHLSTSVNLFPSICCYDANICQNWRIWQTEHACVWSACGCGEIHCEVKDLGTQPTT